MEDFKDCTLEFLKQQEKQQEDLKQQKTQQQEDLQRLHENIERQEERFTKILECLTKQNGSGNLNIFSQESVKSSVGECIYKPEEGVIFEVYFRREESIFKKDCDKWPDEKKSETFTR